MSVDDRGGEVRRWGAGAFEDGLGDLVAVDGQGDGLATQHAFFAGEVLKALRDGEGLEHSGRLVDGTARELVLEGGERGVWDSVQHIQVVGEQVRVSGVEGWVEDELHAVVLSLASTGVVRVRNDGGVLVVVPLLELVWTVADWVLTECVHVVKCGFRKREECGVSQAQWEVGLRLGELDGEGGVVDDLEAFHGLDAFFVAEDGLKEVGGQRAVSYVVVPCVDKALSGNWGAIGEGLAVFDGDAVGLVTFEFDGLCNIVDRGAVDVVVDQAGEDAVDDATATYFVGVAWDERVLWLSAVDEDVVVAAFAA